MTKINSGAQPAVPWRSRPGAFSPRSALLGTGVPSSVYGAGTATTVGHPVPRVRNQAALAVPAAQLEQTNIYNTMTSVFVVGEGASGPPPYRESA